MVVSSDLYIALLHFGAVRALASVPPTHHAAVVPQGGEGSERCLRSCQLKSCRGLIIGALIIKNRVLGYIVL